MSLGTQRNIKMSAESKLGSHHCRRPELIRVQVGVQLRDAVGQVHRQQLGRDLRAFERHQIELHRVARRCRRRRHARVVKPSGDAIPGLYAAGESTGDVYGRYYVGSGYAIASALSLGRVAGREAADFALAQR